MVLGIIGTAGRKGLHKILSLHIFKNMCKEAHVLASNIRNKHHLERLLLVSGGAAWADHVAVNLFKTWPELYDLVIYGPCPWDNKNKQFLDNGMTGRQSWLSNPGKTANYYHKLFQQRTGIDSLIEINNCYSTPKQFSYAWASGFYARNGLVANKVTHLLAFTFGTGSVPTDGGSRNTWDAARNQEVKCIHRNINTLGTKNSVR